MKWRSILVLLIVLLFACEQYLSMSIGEKDKVLMRAKTNNQDTKTWQTKEVKGWRKWFGHAKTFGRWTNAILFVISTLAFVGLVIEGIGWDWRKLFALTTNDDPEKGMKLYKQYLSKLANEAKSTVQLETKPSAEPILAYILSNWYFMLVFIIMLNLILFLCLKRTSTGNSLPNVVLLETPTKAKAKRKRQKNKKRQR